MQEERGRERQHRRGLMALHHGLGSAEGGLCVGEGVCVCRCSVVCATISVYFPSAATTR